jgi:glycosyltransferase involved in cell wall biosynthesis
MYALTPEWANALTSAAHSARTLQGTNLTLDNVVPPEPYSRAVARRVRSFAARRAINLAPERARADIRESLRHAYSAMHVILRPPVPSPEALAHPSVDDLSVVVHASRGDVIWTCAPYVEHAPLRHLAESKRLAGFRVASLAHRIVGGDEAVAARTIDQLDVSDLVLCTTEGAAGGLNRLALECGRPIPNTRPLPLGSDPAYVLHGSCAAPSPSIAPIIAKPYALAVGTVNIDRNYGLLLEVWRTLCLDAAFDLDLIIVGRRGGGGEQIASQLQRSPALHERVHWFGEVTDSDLLALYRRCKVFMLPTLEKGWPLSATEALANGRPVLASSRTTLPENAHGSVKLLDPCDSRAWIGAIRTAATAQHDAHASVEVTTWDTCASVVRRELLELADSAEAIR